jgi:hypothetical protein
MSNERPLTFYLNQDSLFKYCDGNGIDILQWLRLKVTPPNQFNDPFEFLPKIAFSNDEHRSLTDLDGMVDSISETHALACFSKVPDNLLMWSHYAHRHRGIVVEFDMNNSFFSSAKNLMPVNYCSERARASLDSNGIFAFDEHETLVARIKSPAWSYEDEWRWLLKVEDCAKTDTEPFGRCPKCGSPIDRPDGTRLYVKIPSDAVASVIFGVRCCPETENAVRELKKREDLHHLRLWRAKRDEHEFKINVVPADDNGCRIARSRLHC